MTLEIFVKQKSVKIDGKKIPLEQVRIGAKDGSGFLFQGDIKDFKQHGKDLEKERKDLQSELYELIRKRQSIENAMKKAEREIARAEMKLKTWNDILDREVLEMVESTVNDGTVIALFEGTEKGEQWRG